MKRVNVMNKHTTIDKSTGEKKCSCFKRCGGCQLDKVYAQQIEWKQAKADRMLSRFCRPQQIITMDDPYNYRNKVQTVYKVNSSKRIVSGVYQSSTHSMVITDDCFLEDIRAQQIVATLKELMVDFRILPYNEESDQGLLKHTLIRTSQTTGEVMLVLVTATPIFPAKKNFVKAITEKHPYITTIIQNVNKGRVPLTLGDRDIIMYGKGYITDEMCGCKFRISPHSFYQVNPEQTEKLYSKAVSCAELKKGTTEEFVEALGKLRPEKIVYVSCKIETLERDLKLLAKIGYKAQLIQPVDMFPHTTGIENVVLLKRKMMSLTPNRTPDKKGDKKIERKGKTSHR